MAARKSAELSEVEEVAAEIVEDELERQASLFPATDAWENLDDADVLSIGAILEAKAQLVGVPFVITKVVFRQGAYRRAGTKELMPDDYVSIEAVTAPERDRLYDRTRIEKFRTAALKDMNGQLQSELNFTVEDYTGPGEFVVINDGSTGIKRQITAYLAHKKLIRPTVPDLPPIDALSGGLGENVFDQNRDEWERGNEEASKGLSVKLVCRQGLRVSAYEYGNDQSATFYLA